MAGHRVYGVSREPGGHGEVAAEVIADLGTPESLEEVLSLDKCDAVIHGAAILHGGALSQELTTVNCIGTQHLLQVASKWKAGCFVYLSSMPVIGIPRHLPITEDHPTVPESAYHASKLYGEQLCRLVDDGISRKPILRLTSPVGPGLPSSRIFPVFIKRALAGEPLELSGLGTRRQDYVDLRDIASAVSTVLESDCSGIYNIGRGQSVSNRELAEEVITILGSSSRICFSGAADPDDELDWTVSIERARRDLGYDPRHSLGDSILWSAGRRCG